MKTTTFSQFRNNAKRFFDAVEKGETIEIYRHGKPVALLSPAHRRNDTYWKRASSLSLDGTSLSRIILSDREKDE